MSIYFVRTNGNDSTGNGSTGTPWLTLSKAMTVAVAGDVINVGDGTYAENTSASGAWTIAKSLASYLTIQGENGASSAVIITGASGASNTIFNGGTTAFLRFKWITFGMRSGSSYALRLNAACNNLDFQNCTIDAAGNSSALQGIRMVDASFALDTIAFSNCTVTSNGSGSSYDAIAPQISGTGALTNVTFDTCTITGRNAAINASGTTSLTFTNCTLASEVGNALTIASGTLTISGGSITSVGSAVNATGGTLSISNAPITASATAGAGISGSGSANITLTGCTITPGATGVGLLLTLVGTVVVSGGTINTTNNNTVRANGATSIVVSNVVFGGGGNNNLVQFGVDGTSGNATAGSISGCLIIKPTGVTGHALLIGAGCSNFVVDHITIPWAYDHACVIKENAGTIVRYSTLVAGSAMAVYCKAATGANIHHNKLIASSATSYCFQLLAGDTGNKSGTVTFTDNRLIVRGAAKALNWGDSTNDSGGGVCDRNSYDCHGAFGNVYGTSAIATLAALKTAWATYDVTTNDGKSRRAARPIVRAQ